MAAMAENIPPATAIGTDDDPTRGIPYHDKVTADLKVLLHKKRLADRNVEQIEKTLYNNEGSYLENNPHGNIIIGFENYIKGTSSSSVLGGRRKAGIAENERVFSRSSMRYNDAESPGPSSAMSTPSHPTPINTSFVKDSTSNNATPTSATPTNRLVPGLKKSTKRAGEDSESEAKEAKESKKARNGTAVARK